MTGVAGLVLPRIRLACAVSISLFGVTCFSISADDWPQWRGPRRDGVSSENGLLTAWPNGGPKLSWHAENVGTGYASVVVAKSRVYTIGRHGRTVVVTALEELNGKVLWTTQIGSTDRNPASTPTLDGELLFALDPDGHLFCLQAATGEPLWKRNIRDDFNGQLMSSRGYGESPLVDGDRLVCTPGGSAAAIVALDKRDGNEIWRAQIPDLGPLGKDGGGFSSIMPTKAAGVPQYVQLMGRGLVGVAAEDGRFLWGYNAIANTNANIPTPIVYDDFIFSANGYTAGSVLLKLSSSKSSGTPTGVQADVVYALSGSQFQNHHGGVLRLDDRIYGGHGNNNGLPTCLELATGRVIWKRRGPGVGSAAVVHADGHLYFRYQNGLVALIEPKERTFEVKGALEIPGAGGDSWAHPVVANGRLYLREQNHLWVYDIRRETPDTPDRTDRKLSDNPAIAELQRRGGTIELIHADAIPWRSSVPLGKERRLVEHVFLPPANGENSTAAGIPEPVNRFESRNRRPSVLYVELSDSCLTDQGALLSDVHKSLRALPQSLFLSLSSTRVSELGLRQMSELCATGLNLVGINLELCGFVTDQGLAQLRSVKTLRALSLAGTSITSTGLGQLSDHQQLVALDLELCDGVADEACAVLNSIPMLKVLILKKSGFEADRVSDIGLQRLQRLSNLEILNLYGNKVTDAGLAHLPSFPKLRELDLSLLMIGDAGLVHLKPLRELRRLELLYSEGFAGPKLTDAVVGLTELTPHVSQLNLTGSKLTDEGLRGLSKLSELKLLQVTRTPVTESGVEAFRKVRPQCQVVR